jgi:hypothetical protein
VGRVGRCSEYSTPLDTAHVARAHPTGPGVDSAYNRNEYREYLVGAKGGQCVGPLVLKSRSLNLLEPSGPLQDCNGIALPSFIYSYLTHIT